MCVSVCVCYVYVCIHVSIHVQEGVRLHVALLTHLMFNRRGLESLGS